MDTTQLRYFVAVARAGSLTAASTELKVSQPTLTVAVRRLESRLGTTLFHRGRDGMTLTPSGRELLHHATDVLETLGRAEQRVRAVAREEHGRVVLGCCIGVATYFLSALFAGFAETFHGVELELVNATSSEITRSLLEHRADLGVVRNPGMHLELVLLRLFSDRHELYVAADGVPPDARAAAAQLRESRLLFVDSPEARALLAALAARDLGPRSAEPCAAPHVVRDRVARHEGVGILSRRYADADPTAVARLGGGLPVVEDTVCLVSRADLRRTAAVRQVEEAVTALGRRLARV
jgi:DNA-binding transcriptional LysR family regulator